MSSSAVSTSSEFTTSEKFSNPLSVSTGNVSQLPVICGCLVLLLNLGIQLVEAGSVRRKNVSSVLTRALTCLALSIITFWLCGYAFAFSEGHSLLGFESGFFGLTEMQWQEGYDMGHWFLTATIVSVPSALAASAVVERSHMTGHLVIATLLAGVVVPVAAHWVWAQGGWLRDLEVRDAGGVLVVHGVGGVTGLVACLLVGRRVERLTNADCPLPGHSLPLVAVGGWLVCIGMVGKLVGMVPPHEAGAVATNSLLGGAVGALVAVHVFKLKVQRGERYVVRMDPTVNDYQGRTRLQSRRWSYLTAYNGCFTGMISVSGVGASLPPWGALLAGLVGGLVYCLFKALVSFCHVDDPVQIVATQMAGVVVGSLVSGITEMARIGDGLQVGWHLLGLLAVSAWVATLCLVVMLILLVCGKLRVMDMDERAGIDIKKIEEQAYSEGQDGEERTENICVGEDIYRLRTPAGSTAHRLTAGRDKACAHVVPSIRKEEKFTFGKEMTSYFQPGGEVSPRLVAASNLAQSPSTTTTTQIQIIPSQRSVSNQSMDTLTVPNTSNDVPSVTVSSTEDIPMTASSMETRPPYVNVGELRTMLREQKQKLRSTNSPVNQVKGKEEISDEVEVEKENEKSDSLTDLSVDSGVVRLTINTAKNKENFNYLIGDKPKSGGNSGDEEEEQEPVKEVDVNETNDKEKKLQLNVEEIELKTVPIESDIGNDSLVI